MPPKDENQLNKYIPMLTESILRAIRRVPEASEPIGATRMTKDEMLAEYMQMRDDPQKWQTLLTQHNLRDTMRYGAEMERLLAKQMEVSDDAGIDGEQETDQMGADGDQYGGNANPNDL